MNSLSIPMFSLLSIFQRMGFEVESVSTDVEHRGIATQRLSAVVPACGLSGPAS